MAPATAPVSETHAEVFRAISIEQFVLSPTNPRKHFDAKKLDELADSIRQKGVVVPLLVRQIGKGVPRFEIVAGERRYRAAKLAGLTGLQAIVRELSDQDVLELQLIENIQRDDLDPLEEARGYKALLDSNPAKFSAAYIADRIGRREKFVWDRVKLLDLIPEIKQLLEAERILVGHAELLAKLKVEDQKRVITPNINRYQGVSGVGLWQHEAAGLDFAHDEAAAAGHKKDPYEGLKPVTVRELESWIADHVRFDVERMAAVAPLDFVPVAEQVQTAATKPGRAKKVISITHDHYVQPDAKDPSERTFSNVSWKRADGTHKSKRCEKSVLGVVAVGREYGRAFDVCINKDCNVHWKEERLERERRQKRVAKTGGKPTAVETSEARDKREAKAKREQEARVAAERRSTLIEAHAIIAAARQTTKLTGGALRAVAIGVLDRSEGVHFEQANRISDALKLPRDLFEWSHNGGRLTKKLTDAQLITCVVVATLSAEIANSNAVAEVVKAFGVDMKAVEKTVDAELAALATTVDTKTAKATKAAKPAKKAKAKR